MYSSPQRARERNHRGSVTLTLRNLILAESLLVDTFWKYPDMYIHICCGGNTTNGGG